MYIFLVLLGIIIFTNPQYITSICFAPHQNLSTHYLLYHVHVNSAICKHTYCQLTLSHEWLYRRLDTPWTHIPHSATASIRHSTHANVLVPLKNVKYEGDLEMFSCPPHDECGPCRTDFGGSTKGLCGF